MSTPIGPYSPIVTSGGWLVTSGQLGLQPSVEGTPPTLVDGGAAAQLAQALKNAEALLAAHGATLSDVVKTTVFVTDMTTYPVVNETYVAAFGDHRPARSVVGVAALPMGAEVEIELWARRD
jgi:2-iminobutanoate/2-iminopropanoate deaminase